MKQPANKHARSRGLLVVIAAAVLLELLTVIQYKYSRGLLEHELEKNSLSDLRVSALRIQEILTSAEVMVSANLWHAGNHLSEPDYIERLLYNLVDDDDDKIIGAFAAFSPHFYPGKGYYYEPYARQWGDSVSLRMIGSDKHDYMKSEFYQMAMNRETTQWTSPYYDAEGAHAVVITYAWPLYANDSIPVGVLGVDVSTDWIGEVANLNRHYQNSFLMVIAENGRLIAPPLDSLVSKERVNHIVALFNDSTVEREEKVGGHVTGFVFKDKENGKSGHVYYARKKKAPHWQMVLVCYDEEVFGKLDKMRFNILLLGLAGLLVLGLMIQLFIRAAHRLHLSNIAQERISSELRIANDIQTQMLPRENSVMSSDVTISGSLVPAREVGGDLYDFFMRDEKLFFCIGDVSGKGVPSAMLMAVTHSLFRSASAHENNPARMMKTINETCCEGNESNMFVTFFIGVLDLPTGRLRYCNAGHDKPILIVDGELKPESRKPNLPLGVFADINYDAQETMVPAGATLFLYTDGLTEAKDSRHQQFGKERLNAVLQQGSDSPQTLLQMVTDAVSQFVENAEQSDDLTMLAIHYTPKTEKDIIDETLTLKNDARQVSQLSTFIKEVLSRVEMVPKQAREIRLAVEEAVVNVMEYAYPTGTEGDVTIAAKYDGEVVKFVISDAGVAFDPTKAANADTTLSAEDRPIGGLGILLVRKLMDSINYERIGGMNILTLKKTIHNK